MKKMRIAGFFLLAIIAAVTYFWFNNPLNSLVKSTIEKFGSEMTQSEVRVAHVQLSPTDGQGSLSGLSVGNPKGFSTPHAFKANHIEVAIEPATLTKDVVLIHKILVASPDITYENGDNGTNFDAIQRNIKLYLGNSKTADDNRPDIRVIIESLTIRDIKVNYNGMLNLTLPDIELHNIGKKKGGATSAQVVNAIINELNTKLAIELAKTAAITAVGGVAIGIGMGIKSLLGN